MIKHQPATSCRTTLCYVQTTYAEQPLFFVVLKTLDQRLDIYPIPYSDFCLLILDVITDVIAGTHYYTIYVCCYTKKQ